MHTLKSLLEIPAWYNQLQAAQTQDNILQPHYYLTNITNKTIH